MLDEGDFGERVVKNQTMIIAMTILLLLGLRLKVGEGR